MRTCDSHAACGNTISGGYRKFVPGNGVVLGTHYTGYMASCSHVGAGVTGVALLLIGSLSPASSGSTTWLDVPFVHQVKEGCGSAAVAMVMQYWAGRQPALDAAAADAERIDQVLPADSKKGIQGKALKRYLQEHGFAAFVFSGEIADLQQHLANGRPVVVALGLNGARAPLHYVVVVGLKDRAVLVNDPARGKLIDIDLPRFLLAWKPAGNWALLSVPRSDSQPLQQPAE